MHSSDDPSWRLYPHTILEFHTGAPLTIDLRQTVRAPVSGCLRAANLDPTFAVITAFNPRGHAHSDQDNARFESQLEEQLRQRGLQVVHVDGVSPDRIHRERGVAVSVSREEATTLANQYHQSAFFWFDGEAFWVVPAVVEAPAIRLPLTSSEYPR